MPKPYRCAQCGGEFVATDDADARAQAEARRLWGKDGTAADMEVICDDCFREFRDAMVAAGLGHLFEG